MTDIDVNMDRLGIVVHGVPGQLVETAMSGLEVALRRRLGEIRLDDIRDVDMAELALSPVNSRSNLDADALRGLIVERLVGLLTEGREGALK